MMQQHTYVIHAHGTQYTQSHRPQMGDRFPSASVGNINPQSNTEGIIFRTNLQLTSALKAQHTKEWHFV